MGLLVFLSPDILLQARNQVIPDRPILNIPRVKTPPALKDYLGMRPGGTSERKLAKVAGFIQRRPSDGSPVSQNTEAYLGYDNKNLYAVFICFDENPDKILARMTRREGIGGDDRVDIFLDTFHDQLRSYRFSVNPLGVQMDGRWLEGSFGGRFDASFDALWHSEASVTKQGYVVLISIPFKSIRFSSNVNQTWGIVLSRMVRRNNETSFWPQVSSRIDGVLSQEATLAGIAGISSGRNTQVIPFGFFRSFRGIDTKNTDFPQFVTNNAQPDVGVDAKFVISDSFSLDVAINPDFSQVESDSPQVTVNRRFEVYFPERRPFFLENNDFFQTPVNLFFSRRIADPQFGLRLTGKKGPYAIGALAVDDQSPGNSASPGESLHGKRAKFGVLRVNRDIFRDSTVGVLLTDRELMGSHNRVGSVDTHLRLDSNTNLNMQAVTTSTQHQNGTTEDGPAYYFELERTGRQFTYGFEYKDIGAGFNSTPGFVRRRDIRGVENRIGYRFRPEGKYLIAWGPYIYTEKLWDQSGTRLDWEARPQLSFEFVRNTSLGFYMDTGRERLRPKDFSILENNLDFYRQRKGFYFNSQQISQINTRIYYTYGRQVNYVPQEGQEPVPATVTSGNLVVTLRPTPRIRNDNTYILSRLRSIDGGQSIFTNNIIRSRWNWQLNREFSLRVILQYDAVLANPVLTSLETRKNVNADILFTYLVNPWTALYVGYNGNMQDIDLLTSPTGNKIMRSPEFMHDSRQFFVKVSYLLPF